MVPSGRGACDHAALLLRRFNQNQIGVVAPRLIRCEVASSIIIATQHRPPRLTIERAERALEDWLELDIETRNEEELILPAFALVRQYGCAIYDAIYLALALRLGLPFVTADSKLYNRIRQLSDVVWISGYPQTPR